MGVGKTTTCQILKKKLDRAVFLDGDWCWDADPFQVTEETKNMVEKNICFLLNQFLHCSAYENVIFCWVMHEQSIIDSILSGIDCSACRVISISLVCTPEALKKRLQRDIEEGRRETGVLSRSLARIPLYQALHTKKIDVSGCTPEEAADQIAGLWNE